MKGGRFSTTFFMFNITPLNRLFVFIRFKYYICNKKKIMKKINLTQTQIDEIISIYKQGELGMRSIGEKYNISREVVKRILSEQNIELDKPGQKFKGGKFEADKRYREKIKGTGLSDVRYKKWLENNRDRVKAKQYEWRKNNAEKLKNYKREYQKKLISTNPQYKLAQRFRTALWQNIKDNGLTKYKNTFDLLPYTFDELKQHLENQFEDGMTWDNYGEWHVDHVIPQSHFNYSTTDSEEFKLCWSLNNLKPLWGKINLSKNDVLSYLTLPMVRELKNLQINNGVKYKTILISKDYLYSVIEKNGKEYVEEYINDIIDLIWGISPNLPKIDTNENFSKLKEYIGNINPLDLNGDIINAKVNSYGNMFLKSRFNSYWKSSYKNSKSPINLWEDRDSFKTVLKYRLGLNNSGEIFDISLYQMIKGISATRTSISFFKPLLAAYIYKTNLGDIDNPIVFDPSAGFGGRLLGFKAVYPNGKYIACEPNKETYNELLNLVNELELTNVELHNCKFEDFEVNFYYDFAFTSIPYYDLETYSNPSEYSSFEDWKNTFMNKILSLNKALINLSQSVYDKCQLDLPIKNYLINGKNHFKKEINKELFIILK